MKHAPKRSRLAESEKARLKRQMQPTDPWLQTPDGKIPNTEIAEGRAELFRQVANMSISLKTRAQLIEKFVMRAIESDTLQGFKENAEELSTNVRKLNDEDVKGLNKALTKAFDDYARARKYIKEQAGQSAGRPSLGAMSLAAYKRRHGIG